MRVRLLLATFAGAVVLVAPAGADRKPGGSVPNSRPVVVRVGNGFDWGDVALGAAAGIGAAVAAIGAITVVRNR